MKKTKKIFAFLLFLVMMFSHWSLTEVRGNYSGVQTIIPVTINWDGNDDSAVTRPVSVTVTLYKYLGEFNQATATLVETKTVTAADDWKCDFNITNEALYQGTTYSPATAYKFKVVQSYDVSSGYTETQHTDPSVIFNPPDVAGDWVRTTPCSELSITTTGVDKSIVVMKKGNSCTVWSVDMLSETEKQIIISSALAGIDGIGNPTFNFCFGLGSFLPCGMTVTENLIHFEDPSNWSFFAIGTYNKSSTLANAAYLTNTRNTYGSLTVSKVIAGNAPSATKDFAFTVTLNDTTINGVYGDVTFTAGVATFVLKCNESVLITGLPNGTGYTVTEEDYTADGYVTTMTGATGAIDENVPKVAVFTNTRNTYGDLRVEKTLVGNDIDMTKEFAFTVTLNDNTINGIYGGMLFNSGVASFTLTGGESIVAAGLPNGVAYTVTENDYTADGYVTTMTGATGTIKGNAEYIARFTNTRNTYGRLFVYKDIAGNAADPEKLFNFTVTLSDRTINGTYGRMTFTNGVATFALKGGEWLPASGLPNGILYTVTEDDYTADGYVTTMTGEAGTIVGNSSVAAFFINTRNASGTLTVAKNLQGNDVEIAREFEFTITLSNTDINETFSDVVFTNGVATLKLRGGEFKLIEGLPNGVKYTVAETDYSGLGYTTTKTGDTGTISETAPQYAAFTNTRNSYGSLTVSKAVAGNAADSTKEFDFTVTLGTNAITGVFGGMTFNEGVATFSLKDGESVTATGLPNGVTYTVVEDSYILEGYITTHINDIGTIVGNSTINAAFTNTRNAAGSLTIYKVLEGNDVDAAKDFTFKITLSDTSINGTFSDVLFTNGEATLQLKGGENKVIEGLPNGTGYIIVETDYTAEGYTTLKTGDVGTISELVSSAAIFTNTRNTYGDLRIKKYLAGNAPDENKVFLFTITLSDKTINGLYGGMLFNSGVALHTLKGGEWVTAVGLPNGITYTVTEDDYSLDGYLTTMSGNTGSIVGNELTLAEFTNTRDVYSDLIIRKTVTGSAGETNKYFTFTITFDASGIYEYTGDYSGTISSGGTIQLRHGEEITIHSLPVGTTYSVTESDNADYKVTSTGDSGVIVENEIALAHFTNCKDPVPVTGDNTDINLWIKVMGLSLLSIVALVVIKRKTLENRIQK
jgi:hypothetical protein